MIYRAPSHARRSMDSHPTPIAVRPFLDPNDAERKKPDSPPHAAPAPVAKVEKPKVG